VAVAPLREVVRRLDALGVDEDPEGFFDRNRSRVTRG
jgi:hypothetical protein